MAKWADYLISQVLYDQNHIITKVKQHRDIGNKISGGEIVDRDALANNLGHGVKYMTVYGDLGKIRMGKNVRYFRAYEDHYIRIDDNKVMTDNLGELPGLVESQQEEQPVLAEAKPKPAVETKPLSELSSAFFSEQVEQEPEPAAVETEVTPEPAAVETEVTPEPAAVETEVTPKETKKKVMKTKSPTKKKPTKKKSVTKKKPTKKKSVTKKKPTKKKSVTKKKPTKKKSVTKKKPTKKKRA
uniref:Surface antigen protein n=1 Tax=uncultured marine thaumarchaeote KM3_88_G03 TaxID=1456337 RepID=A0A075HV23_9ARCH|nr:surface antigen protein [uncultured marine thaumarchaeote KM3_88_G03]